MKRIAMGDAVILFDDEAEAIRIANGMPYGLMAYVWTVDLSRAMRMAKAICSTVMINAVTPLGESPWTRLFARTDRPIWCRDRRRTCRRGLVSAPPARVDQSRLSL